MNPLPEVEVVLVSKEPWTPYSGMLPSRLAGWYRDEEMHFDLMNLCAQSGAVFLDDEAVRVDASGACVFLKHRPPLHYDIASLNIGITPDLPPGAMGHPHVLAVKPISRLLPQWARLWRERKAGARWVMVGAGAAGFELAVISSLCARSAAREGVPARGAGSEIVLLEAEYDFLPGHSRAVREKARRLLEAHGAKLKLGARVAEVRGQELVMSSGERVAFDEAVFTTGARAPSWFRESGLPVDEQGFVRVDPELRVQGFPNLFAAGDCISFDSRPLPKSGVYAVREGPTLTENIRAVAMGNRRLRPYRPQWKTMALLTSGDHRAMMSYGNLNFEGRWVWNLKSRIDRRFMEKFGVRDVRPMTEAANTCGGCGGKVSAADISVLIARLRANPEFARLLPEKTEDVGLLGDMVTSIDGFRSFTSDLYFFAQVGAWHALNDLFASGVKPTGVSVYAGMPEARPRLRRDKLQHLMAGVLSVLSKLGVPLLNAHTAVSHETTLVFSVSGKRESSFWVKSGARAGDVLIMTKPVGTGALLQAQMAGALPISAWDGLREHLLLSHEKIPTLLADCGVHACTDISGFGIAGHLWEMAESSGVKLEIDSKAIAVLPGFAEVSRKGFRSALAEENRLAFGEKFVGLRQEDSECLWDPQTHGPLVVAVEVRLAEQVLSRLKESGFPDAYKLGRVTQGTPVIAHGEINE